MPGPSDLRKVQYLLNKNKFFKKLFDYRINIKDKNLVYQNSKDLFLKRVILYLIINLKIKNLLNFKKIFKNIFIKNI